MCQEDKDWLNNLTRYLFSSHELCSWLQNFDAYLQNKDWSIFLFIATNKINVSDADTLWVKSFISQVCSLHSKNGSQMNIKRYFELRIFKNHGKDSTCICIKKRLYAIYFCTINFMTSGNLFIGLVFFHQTTILECFDSKLSNFSNANFECLR